MLNTRKRKRQTLFIQRGENAQQITGRARAATLFFGLRDIDNINIAAGRTTLWDAISSMAKATDEKARAEKLSEKVLVLITDGEDRDSKITEKQLIEELKGIGVKVYIIGLTQQLDEGSFETR